MRHPHDFSEDCQDMMALSDRLNHPEVAAYFDGNGHRRATVRAIFDIMGAAPPTWLERSPSGRASVTKAAMDRFRADNPQERLPRGYVPPKPR